MRSQANPFTPAMEDAIRGIRANWPPRKVMVFDRMREYGVALVKAGGGTYVVHPTGGITKLEEEG